MKYIIRVNNGIYNNEKNVFSLEEVQSIFEKWSEGNKLLDEDGEEYTINELINLGGSGETVDLFVESMVEMGDDYVSVSIIQLIE